MEIYRFATCSLDVERRELRRGQDLVALEPQVFDVLLYLIRNRDRIVSKDDLFAAVWGRRIVSESTLSSRIFAVRDAVGDDGGQQRIVRTARRKGFRFVAPVHQVGATRAVREHETTTRQEADGNVRRYLISGRSLSHRRPTVAILPFASASSDPALKNFIDGVVEDFTTALARFPWLFVVARTSSLVYDGQRVDIRRIGRELGVSYVIEGSVRRIERRIRITVRLIDAAAGVHLWATSLDLRAGGMLRLQDLAAAQLVGAVGPELEQAELERIRRQPAETGDAYGLYLQGMASVREWTEASLVDALRLFNDATESDPGFAPAYGMAAYCYVQRKSYGWFADRSREIDACERLSRRAAERGKEDAVTLTRAAHALAAVVGDIDGALALIEQARRLQPNLSLTSYVSGWLHIFRGQPKAAIIELNTALRLSPFDALAFKMHAAMAYAHLFVDRYDEACLWAGRAIRSRPNYLTAIRGAAASHACAGRLGEARRLMSQMRHSDSALRLSQLESLIPLRRANDFDRWADGLRLAGLPA